MMWKSTEKRIGWELMYVFAGGLALGTLVNDSGAPITIVVILLMSITGYLLLNYWPAFSTV